ncbi:hypothetical protein ACH5RR_004768 [Cinchona calisaya]|uniref:AB hydrolase-1 domain-containing protein n=1 Tax=Cinchona calisaya TaxID=153742 RepID=A0ABD3AZF7_9GENT
MGEVSEPSRLWREELASLVEDTGIRFNGQVIGISTPAFETKKFESESPGNESSESLKDQIKGFAKAWGEMVVGFGRGCKDVVQQTLLTEDSYIVKKTRGPLSEVSERLRFFNQYLPEDRDPLLAWPVIFFVFILALSVLGVNNKYDSSVTMAKKVRLHPPSAARILLPDGRYLAYHDFGVPADRARFSLIIPHGFLFSRLAGIPGIKMSLLEEFGVRLLTYDRPGFGESDPHPDRNLNSSAVDMLNLADAVGIKDQFWILAYSDAAIHAWAALNYIPKRIAGAAMFAPLVNPYDSSMTKEEMSRTWEKWTQRRRFMFYLARRFPKLLNYFYRRTYLSGKHGQIDKWLSLSLEKGDKILIQKPTFEELWQRNVEELIRQGSTKPFVEEAVLQVSYWGFSLVDLQVQKKCSRKGIPWLKFIYGQEKCELTGFLGPIHIWQGMDDLVVPPSVTDYVARILPNATIHKLPDEGHFSYLFLCDDCHRQIFSTLFGSPQDPLGVTDETPSGYD